MAKRRRPRFFPRAFAASQLQRVRGGEIIARKTSLGPDLQAQEENVDIAGPRRQVGLNAAGVENSVGNRADQKILRIQISAIPCEQFSG